MNPTAIPLPLRDIHLLDPISWWPPAFGWWILLTLIITFLCLLGFVVQKSLKPTLKKEALKSFKLIEKSFSDSGDTSQCLSDLSLFLRRVSIAQETKYGGITGIAWLEILDSRLKEPEFSQGIGKILLYAPYQPFTNAEDTSKLLQLCRKWVETL